MADDLSIKEGALLYQQNCMACHQLDKQVVGPSLVEVAHIYKENPSGIVRWSLNPGYKRKLAIRMPPMTHLGKDKLSKIAEYILKVTKGKRYRPEKEPEDLYKELAPAKLQRMFMPYAGPAAIALSLSEKTHICWDAGTCQFRYAWQGDFIDQWPVWRGNGNALAVIKGNIFTQVDQGNPFKGLGEIKFKGYRDVDEKVVFSYSIGDVNFESTFTSLLPNKVSMNIKTNSKEKLSYEPTLLKGKWSVDKGVVKNGVLKLTEEESKGFTIIYYTEE